MVRSGEQISVPGLLSFQGAIEMTKLHALGLKIMRRVKLWVLGLVLFSRIEKNPIKAFAFNRKKIAVDDDCLGGFIRCALT